MKGVQFQSSVSATVQIVLVAVLACSGSFYHDTVHVWGFTLNTLPSTHPSLGRRLWGDDSSCTVSTTTSITTGSSSAFLSPTSNGRDVGRVPFVLHSMSTSPTSSEETENKETPAEADSDVPPSTPSTPPAVGSSPPPGPAGRSSSSLPPPPRRPNAPPPRFGGGGPNTGGGRGGSNFNRNPRNGQQPRRTFDSRRTSPQGRGPGGGPGQGQRPNFSDNVQLKLQNPLQFRRVVAPPRNTNYGGGGSANQGAGGGNRYQPRQQQGGGGGGYRQQQQGGGGRYEQRNTEGGTGPGKLLQNPQQISRMTSGPPGRGGGGGGGAAMGNRQGGQQRDTRGGPARGPGGPGRPWGGGVGADTATADGTGKDRGRARGRERGAGKGRGVGAAAGPGGPKNRYNRPGAGRTSLRIGNRQGRKGGRRRGSLKKKDRSREKALRQEREMERNKVFVPDTSLTVGQLAELLDEKPGSVVKFLMTDLGVMAAVSQTLDRETSVAVVEGFGRLVAGEGDEEEYDDDEDWDDEDDDDDESALAQGFALDEDDEEDLIPRPPVVTIMGHVDHGKTSLLDAIRNTNVVSGESGGITQHIAAYQVEHQGKPITFIDTPGHAAFSDMRARGANITDIVILVVAADDGVKQQTADSIVCARQAGVPLVVAINKCDLETADPTKVQTELTSYDLLTEEFGGEVLSSQISAKEGTNLDELLSKVMLQAELEDLKANPDRDAQGTVVEARVERGLGTVATLLIQRGTIRVGDAFVAGETAGRVRALISTDGKGTRLEEAGPSVPVNVVGFNDGVPSAGDMLVVAEDEQTARELAMNRQRIARERQASSYQSNLMSNVASVFAGAQKEQRQMCVVVKADVQGSAEALARSLSELKLENDEVVVTVNVLVADVGDVTKTDVAIAGVTPDTSIIAFNTAATMAAMDDARVLDIPIGYYNIVYDAIESVESRMQEVLSPTPEGEYVGSAIVQEVFNIGGTGNIAGSKCQDGFIRKGSNVRIMRGDKIMSESKIRTLRNFKAEVDIINAGDECGIGLMEFEDFEAGDVIESYVEAKK